MKHTLKIIIFMLALLVYVSILACGGSGSDDSVPVGCQGDGSITFAESDFEGTWQHLIKGSTIFGSLMLGPDGSVTGGSNSEIGGGSENYTDGDLSIITNSGAVSGTIIGESNIRNIAPGTPPSSGQMSRDKGLMIEASEGPDEIGLFMKTGSSFPLNSLEGPWTYGNQNEYGVFSVAPITGNVTGTWNLAAGGTNNDIAGTLTVTGAGVIEGNIITNSINYAVTNGQMSSDRNVIYLALTPENAFVAVKRNANFGACDLGQERSTFVSFSDSSPQVAYGTITMTSNSDNTATINSGTWNQIGGGSGAYDGGTVDIGTDGFISGGTINSDAPETLTVLMGQVSANKNFSMNVSQDTSNNSYITLFIRTP